MFPDGNATRACSASARARRVRHVLGSQHAATTAGRPDAALDAVERALARATDPGWMAERVQLSAWLVPLHADPRWSRALAAAR